MIDVFIGGLNCLVTAFIVRSICSLVTGFSARAVTPVLRYNSDYLKLKVRLVVLLLLLSSQLYCLVTTFVKGANFNRWSLLGSL